MLSHSESPIFSVDPDSGLVAPATQCPSPNCDARPVGAVPELIVIHGISLPPGEFGGDAIRRLFCNQLLPDGHPYFAEIHHLRVSAHLLIDRDGALTQFVPLHARAWHAGVSVWQGKERCNDFSIGIELEGTDDLAYSDAQYRSLGDLIAALRAGIPTLAEADVVGHCDIAPGRKTDPGEAFDWSRIGVAR
ncbi:MAG: 1,6-anhydro-N-acetylmuramyl-L-alanine amidase AmpD [Pseudomonadota bacterium]